MKTQVVQPDPGHLWQARPGHQTLVVHRGAVRFDFPEDWILCSEPKYACLTDRRPPDGRCSLIVSCRRIPARAKAIPLVALLRNITKTKARPITHRGSIIRFFHPPLEAAWLEMRVMDPTHRREACTRVCLARAGCTQVLIVFDFWPEDTLRLYDTWNTVLETLVVGDREKRG